LFCVGVSRLAEIDLSAGTDTNPRTIMETGESIGNEFSGAWEFVAGIFRAENPVRLPSQLLNCFDYGMGK